MKVGGSEIDVDVDATREAYERLNIPGPEECGCSYCRNWIAARKFVYSTDVVAFLESMGIASGYETEVWEASWDDGRHYYGGWYPFVGLVTVLDEDHEKIGEVDFWVSRGVSYGVPWIGSDKVNEIHFSTVIGWLLDESPKTEPVRLMNQTNNTSLRSAKRFKKGDRVLMLRHADWKTDIVGTIAGPPSVPQRLRDETYDVSYGIDFDDLHTDLTDETSERVIEYSGCAALSRYLRLLDAQ